MGIGRGTADEERPTTAITKDHDHLLDSEEVMATISYWRCDRCGIERSVRTGDPRTYGDGRGYGITCRDQRVWCRTCGDLRAAELIDRLQDLKDRVRILHGGKSSNGSPLRGGRGGGQPLLTADPWLTAQIAWRRRRRSREKCFTCGSPRFVVARTVDVRGSLGMEQAIPHPGCGGLFRCIRGKGEKVPDEPAWVPDEGPGPVCRPWWRLW